MYHPMVGGCAVLRFAMVDGFWFSYFSAWVVLLLALPYFGKLRGILTGLRYGPIPIPILVRKDEVRQCLVTINMCTRIYETTSVRSHATPVFPCAQFDGDGMFTKPAVFQQRLEIQMLELRVPRVFFAQSMLMPLPASTPNGSIIPPDSGETKVQDSIVSPSARVPLASIARTIAPSV